MKWMMCAVFLLVGMFAKSQGIGLRLGHSLVPATQFAVRYEHWTNSNINFSLSPFFEKAKFNGLNYSCLGADLLAEFTPARQMEGTSLINWRTGFGLSWQVENEPWLYKGLSFMQRMNYGVVGEASLQCYLTETFRLNTFIQQKYLLRKQMGTTRFCFGLGLTYNLNSF